MCVSILQRIAKRCEEESVGSRTPAPDERDEYAPKKESLVPSEHGDDNSTSDISVVLFPRCDGRKPVRRATRVCLCSRIAALIPWCAGTLRPVPDGKALHKRGQSKPSEGLYFHSLCECVAPDKLTH